MSHKIIRRKYLTCRLSLEEKQQIESDALGQHQNISDYIREKLLQETKIIPKQE